MVAAWMNPIPGKALKCLISGYCLAWALAAAKRDSSVCSHCSNWCHRPSKISKVVLLLANLLFHSSRGGLRERVYLADLGRRNFALFYNEEYFLFSVDPLSDPYRNGHRMVWRHPDLFGEGKIENISQSLFRSPLLFLSLFGGIEWLPSAQIDYRSLPLIEIPKIPILGISKKFSSRRFTASKTCFKSWLRKRFSWGWRRICLVMKFW